MAREEDLKVIARSISSSHLIELKVSVDCCDGCKRRVLKALSIKGVLKMEIHPSQPLVTVTGNVDAPTLIKRLAKYGKVAEVLPKEDEKQGKGDKNVEIAEGSSKDKSKDGKHDKKASTEQEKSSKCCEARKSNKAEKVEADRSIKNPNMTESCNENTGGKQTDEALGIADQFITTAATAAAAVTAPTPQMNCMVTPGMMQGAVFTHASAAPRVYYPMEQYMVPVTYPMANTYSAPATSIPQRGYPQAASPPCHCCHDPYRHHFTPQQPLPRLTDYFNDDNTGSCRVM